MKWPWVSRALHERVLQELHDSEVERKQLLDRALGMAPEASVEAVERMLSEKAEEGELFPVTETTASPAGLRLMAQNAAFKRAGRVA